MMLFENGTINGDIDYKDLCQEGYKSVRIAYNNQPWWFEIDESTSTMIEYPHWWSVVIASGQLPWDYEILKSFFVNYKIKPKWINCNQNYGRFDVETGHWTGAVGQVKILTNKFDYFAYF